MAKNLAKGLKNGRKAKRTFYQTNAFFGTGAWQKLRGSLSHHLKIRLFHSAG